MRSLAVDPGLKGAIAILDDGELIHVEDLPTKKVHIGRKLKTRLDEHAMLVRLRELIPLFAIDNACIEGVWVRPGQGSVSSAVLVDGAAVVRGMLLAWCDRVISPAPRIWKEAMGLDAEKAKSLDEARRLWPHMAEKFRLKKWEGRAEAALLGLYAQRLDKSDREPSP